MRGVISVQSHVVFGHAGNSSAVFPLQRMGLEVFPIHTVQFSNHTQYQEGWTGRVFSPLDITDLTKGLKAIGAFEKCDAVLTGYLGSVDQCESITELVHQVMRHNPKALYVCDPVMGDPIKGCIVDEGITEYIVDKLMPMADVIVPNQFELSKFVGIEITDVSSAVAACKKALSLGPKIVLVKHLHSVADGECKFSMMLAFDDKYYIVQRPNLYFSKQPVGVGDLISAIFVAGLLKGWTPVDAFKHCNEAVYGVVKTTQSLGEWELQTIMAQEEIINPTEKFDIGECVVDESMAYYSA